MLAKLAASIVVLALSASEVRAGGLIGDAIEGLCGNCGVGRTLDGAHERLGQPLDVPGRVIRESGVETLGPLLAEAIRHSRNDARSAGTQPIPVDMYRSLSQYFDMRLLDLVQYRVGQGHELSVQANSIRFGDASAVALIDTIIFRHSSDAQSNDILWAHELTHIQQYQSWGLLDFAKRYVRDYSAIEREADEGARRYEAVVAGISRNVGVRASGNPPGFPMQVCGCWGPNPHPVASEPQCMSGAVRVQVCAGMCAPGHPVYGYVCQ